MTLSTGAGAPKAPNRHALVHAHKLYLHQYVQDDGRVIDRSLGNGITTSEGQAYAMLRSLWSHDRKTFEKVRIWTLHNLQANDVATLPAWKWGHRDDGSWGTYDTESASDADVLMAWALFQSGSAWRDDAHRAHAHGLLARIYDTETRQVGEHTVLLPGSWARDLSPVPLNPSYFVPSAFRTFAEADPGHDWTAVLDGSYAVLDACTERYGLTPDWCWIDPETGALVDPPEGETAKLNFGFEAMRVPWALTADLMWHGEPRARALLDRFGPLADRFARDGAIPAIVHPDGTAEVPWESRALYGSLLASWAIDRPAELPKLLQRLVALQSSNPNRSVGLDYYADNWVWFGQALWSGLARPLETT